MQGLLKFIERKTPASFHSTYVAKRSQTYPKAESLLAELLGPEEGLIESLRLGSSHLEAVLFVEHVSGRVVPLHSSRRLQHRLGRACVNQYIYYII